MVHVSFYRNYGKTYKKPPRPYEKGRLDAELKLVGEYGLRRKRELWRVQYALSRIRNAARMLLTLEEKDPRRIFEGEALMNIYGLLDESQNKLDYVLALTVENFLERRLQTLVFKTGMAKSIQHARVLIKQRHIRFGPSALNKMAKRVMGQQLPCCCCRLCGAEPPLPAVVMVTVVYSGGAWLDKRFENNLKHVFSFIEGTTTSLGILVGKMGFRRFQEDIRSK